MYVRRLTIPLLTGLVIVAASVLLDLNGCGGYPENSGQHIVVIFQENRTPDNLFQDPVLKARGAHIASSGIDSTGEIISLQKLNLITAFDLNHSHGAFELMYAAGKMNGADKVRPFCPEGRPHCFPPRPQFAYVDPAQVQPYFDLAEQYTFGDQMFQTNQGPSFPAHQFIISGTSAPSADSSLFASENPSSYQKPVNPDFLNAHAGCLAPADEFVNLIDSHGNVADTVYPCFEHPTLIDLLAARHISWRYYAPSAGSIWTGPDAIQHICQPQADFGTAICTGSLWSNVIIPQTQVLSDIASHNLPQVSWVIPDGRYSDHPGLTDHGLGPSWVAAVVNAIGNSAYWNNTTIIITWDDWGGWYDHVAPPVINSYEYGFRVPLIVVSPFAKHGYISHRTHDFGSILKFIESQYGLPSLGYADSRADDLSDCFDLTQKPSTFVPIAAPVSADFFLTEKGPPNDPDDD